MRAERPARTAMAAASLLLLAACGSTVSLGQRGQLAGSGLDTPGLGGTALSTGDVQQSTAQPSTATTSAGSEANPGGTVTTSSGASSSDAGSGPVTGTPSAAHLAPIEIGALTADGAGAFQKSLGFKGATTNQTSMITDLVNYFNAHGGMAGHKITLVHYDVAAGSDPSTAYQAACQSFTTDHHVVAVTNVLAFVPANFFECMRKHGVIVSSADSTPSSAFFSTYSSTLYAPSGVSYTRVLSNSVDALYANGWLTSKSKVGVVAFDSPDPRLTITDGLKPALSRHGLSIAADGYTSTDNSAAGAYPGIVLKFKRAGIDRVFFGPGGEPIYFALVAAQQGYHPHYELSSYEYPQLLTQNLPSSQLVGSAGLGWQPFLDLPLAGWERLKTPGQSQCIATLAKNGQDLKTGTNMAVAAWICDDWYFLKVALSKVSTISASAMQSAVARLGGAFASAATFSTLFSSSQHDGASEARLLTYGAACNCYTYSTNESLQ